MDADYLPSPETSRELTSLRHGSRIFCPWCEDWFSQEAFIQLLQPLAYKHLCPPIYKHGGPDGCKRLFPIAEEA